MIEQILSPKMIDALGWTLIHALWQGALFALLLGVLLIALWKYSAQARYWVSVGMLVGFFVTVGLTFWGLASSSEASANRVAIRSSSEVSSGLAQQHTSEELAQQHTSDELAALDASDEAAALDASDEAAALDASDEAAALDASDEAGWLASYFSRHLPLIVTLWLLGVLVLQLRLLGQLAYVQRLKSYGVEAFPPVWTDRVKELEEKIDIGKSVKYLISGQVASPLAVGWLRPAVIFPHGLIDQLRESQVATILAHELAHIKRDDFLVNLLQRFLSTFFFFHPGIWWMNARIEEEREHACDDLAIQATGERIGYAKILIELKENQMIAPTLSMALTGHKASFSHRIRRVLSGYLGLSTYREGFVTCLIFVATLGLAFTASGQQVEGNGSELSDRPAEVLDENIDTDPYSLLPAPAGNGNLALVKYLLDNGEDIDGLDEYGRTALQAAVSGGKDDVVKLLISRGASTEVEGCGLVFEAVNSRKLSTYLLLKSYGLEASKTCAFWYSAVGGEIDLEPGIAVAEYYPNADLLATAVANHCDELVSQLLSEGYDPNQPITKWRYISKEAGFIHSFEGYTPENLPSELAEKYVFQYEREDWTLMEEAVQNGDWQTVERLLEAGVDPAKGKALAEEIGKDYIINLFE
ncbi:MAG: M56 family metallopeptidase [Bacteroidota bacterium]